MWDWDKYFCEYFGLLLSVSFHQRSILIFNLIPFVSEGQAAEGWEPSNKAMFFQILGEHWTEKYLHLVSFFNVGFKVVNWFAFMLQNC